MGPFCIYYTQGWVFDPSLAIVSPLGFSWIRAYICACKLDNFAMLGKTFCYLYRPLFVGLYWVVCQLSVNGLQVYRNAATELIGLDINNM